MSMYWILPLSIAPLAIADVQRSQFLAVAGFVMLGWVLARRTLKMRKRVNADTRAANKELAKIRNAKAPVLPLSDAPPETQRWQVALFDTQRELKAELDTRIVIVQTLLRQVDAKIQRLSELQNVAPPTPAANPVGNRRADVEALVMKGHTAEEIAAAIGLPLGDVELTIATTRVG
ncbi:hypothetical protein [Rubripirellula reticaptiva]|uniref:Uncharacterized protein n=1 Tax=Rubripirellula reticaptiva TaxID=2528013 RepID=A0A5C6F8L0_9BACT|nr:hypothetical protein [Rubripirellula reticaptiva]TWU57625.1 hypothetical protein Poly59_05320 [Rubripirellula reticaptiva]